MAAPPPPDQGAPPPDGVTLRKWAGIKNTVTRERLGPDELELAINCDLDDTGQPHRRRGFKKVAVGDFSSLFESDLGTVYGVVDGELGIINPNLSFLPLASGFTNATVCYVQVGHDIYYSTGDAGLSGTIDDQTRTVGPWGADPDYWFSPVVNTTATLGPVAGRLFGKPPQATALAYFNGRIYLANKKTLWATVLWLPNFVDKTAGFVQFEHEITMVGQVIDGLYVGTTEGVWFLSGPAFPLKRTRVMDNAAIPGSMVYVPSELANPPQVGLEQRTPSKVSILFLTSAGYCGGQDGGICYNFTEETVVFPGIGSASAMFRKQSGINQYVVVGNSRGDPQANTRIGDYVLAELVVAGTWRQNDDCINFVDSFEIELVT